MKKIPLKNSESLTKAVEEELEILGKLRHHHVVELHETFRSPTTVWVVRRRDARNSSARNSSARNSILTRRYPSRRCSSSWWAASSPTT